MLKSVNTKPTIQHVSDVGVVLSDRGSEWKVKKVILTTGSWSHDNLSPELCKRSRAGRVKLTWFSPKPGRDFSSKAFPVFQRLVSDGALYGAPSLDGGGSVKIAPGGAPTKMSDPGDYFRGQTVEEILYMEKHVERYFLGLNKSPIRAGAWTDFYVDDGIPFLGYLPHSKNILLANGFAGFGFKMCPGIGRIAADLVQGKTELHFKFMEPTRSLGTFSGKAK